MVNICKLLPLTLCLTAAAQNKGQDQTALPLIYITHVTVIDTETGKEAADQTVTIAGDRISDVRRSTNTTLQANARVVDGMGKYLIPGLWDMHVHTWDYESTYPLYIANGVTGVRDMFGPPDSNKFRSELTAKKVVTRHFYLASPIIDGHPKVWPTSIEVNTPEEARHVVDEQTRRGADFIKVYSRLSRESYFAIIEESRRQKIPGRRTRTQSDYRSGSKRSETEELRAFGRNAVGLFEPRRGASTENSGGKLQGTLPVGSTSLAQPQRAEVPTAIFRV